MGNNGFQNCSPAAAAALPVLYMQLALTTKTKSSVQNWCLTLQVWPSSRAALWASTGLSMTRPVRPEKSMATREFSDTLRCSEEGGGGRCGGGRGEGKSEEGGRVRGEVDKGPEVKQARHSHWGMTNPVCTQDHSSTQEQRCVGKVSKAQIKDKCTSPRYNTVVFSEI